MKRLIVNTVCTSVAALFAVSVLSAQTATPAPAKTPAATAQKSAGASAKAAKTVLVDINSAGKTDLMALPGIDDGLAEKIIGGRPYKAKNQLVSKKILTKAAYDKIATQIVAKQAKKSSGK